MVAHLKSFLIIYNWTLLRFGWTLPLKAWNPYLFHNWNCYSLFSRIILWWIFIITFFVIKFLTSSQKILYLYVREKSKSNLSPIPPLPLCSKKCQDKKCKRSVFLSGIFIPTPSFPWLLGGQRTLFYIYICMLPKTRKSPPTTPLWGFCEQKIWRAYRPRYSCPCTCK